MAGLRLGQAGTEALIQAMQNLQDQSTLNSASIVQKGCAGAQWPRVVDGGRRGVEARRNVEDFNCAAAPADAGAAVRCHLPFGRRA